MGGLSPKIDFSNPSNPQKPFLGNFNFELGKGFKLQ